MYRNFDDMEQGLNPHGLSVMSIPMDLEGCWSTNEGLSRDKLLSVLKWLDHLAVVERFDRKFEQVATRIAADHLPGRQSHLLVLVPSKAVT
jgi:hypothetical protein